MIAALLLIGLQATPDQPARVLNPDAVISYRDYPTESLRRNEYGLVSIAVHVAADGSVTGCTVTETSSHVALDSLSCRLFRTRARFAPATDATGQPVASDYRAGMSWGIETHMPRISVELALQAPSIPADYKTPPRAKLVFDASGHVTACEITVTSGSDVMDRSLCAYVTGHVVIPAPKSRSKDIAAVGVRYVTARFTAAPAQ